MAITTQMRTDVANLYVALFGRAPERDGLGYWVNQLDAGKTVAQIAQEMYNTDPARAFYPTFLTNDEIIGRFYTNVLGRTADADGLAYWSAKLTAGQSKGSVIAEMITAVTAYTGTDAAALDSKTLFNNKVDVGLYYAVTLGGNDVTAATTIMTGITKDAATVTAAKTTGSTSSGSSYTLTDAVDVLTGTAGNDSFTGGSAELAAADSINGAGGTDTAVLYLDAANESINAAAVEVFKVQATGGARTLTMSNVSGATEVVSNGSTEDLAFAAVQNAVKVTVIGGDGSDDVEVELKDGVITGTLSVEVQGANIDDLAVSNDDQTEQYSAVTITASGSSNSTIDTLTDSNNTAVTALRTVTVAGAKRLTIVDELTGVTTIDASGSTGGARVVIDDAATGVTFTGGSGNDRVDVQAANLTALDKLDGGAGTDTLRISDDDMLTTANAANVKNFEILEGFAAALVADATYDVDSVITNNALTGIIVNSAAATSDISVVNINAAALGDIQIVADADDVTFSGKDFISGGTSDTATIQFGNGVSTDIDVGGPLTFTNVDVLNIKSVSDGSAAAGEQHSVVDLTATDLEKVVLSGDQEFSLDIAATTTGLTEVDASAMTRAASIDVGDAAIVSVLMKGTTKADALVADNAATGATIYTGGGSDTVTLEATAADTLVFTATALNAGDVLAGNALTVNGADTGTIFNFSSALEALLKVSGAAVSAATANVDIDAATMAATTNVDATVGVADIVFQIDLDGDGVYGATTDFQITFVGAATAGAAGVQYNFTNDYFELV